VANEAFDGVEARARSVADVETGKRTGDSLARQAVIKLFDDTRKRLVETGTRNRLVHVNRTNTRGNVLNVVNERSDDVYALLFGGKTMRFAALGQDRGEDRGGLVLANDSERDFDEGRFTDNQLDTRLGPDALQKKLLKIAREAQTAEEESGVNMLYLAMGFLTWFEDKSSSLPREAPLVLLPVELCRNTRTSTYDIRARDEDVLTNLPLQQRLKDDFGIDLPELEVSEVWKPFDYFTQVETVIAARDRWKIDPDAIQLGFFSFSKLLMYRDLDIGAWEGDALAGHALTRGLLYERFDAEEPLFKPTDRLDEVLPPEKLFHVVDADASQAKVIEEVRAGRNVVVQGPPGTGKSQTITNIVAAAVREGKRVLFLAEKMAALSVVHERLVKVGLRDVCLELHSRSANKKSVLGELARTLSQASAVPGMPGAPTALTESRDRLNDLAAALHRPIGNTGETAYSVLGRQSLFIGNGYPPPSLKAECLASMSREAEAKLLAVIEDYGAILGGGEKDTPHPFEGSRNLDLQPVDLARLASMLSFAREIVGANDDRSAPVDPASPDPLPIEVPPVVERQMPPYKRAIFRVNSSYEPHEAPVSVLVELVQKIVNTEGPIHVEEVARRIAACFDREKAGSRILAATRTALIRARSGNSDLLTDGTFWYTQTQADAPPVRDRSVETGATIKADSISLLEIKAAFKIARDDNAGGDDADLVRSVARLMGFKRVGPDLQARIAAGLAT
jgi:hypothetical protein